MILLAPNIKSYKKNFIDNFNFNTMNKNQFTIL